MLVGIDLYNKVLHQIVFTQNKNILSETSGFHGDEYEDVGPDDGSSTHL
jgi:hypothetical protein